MLKIYTVTFNDGGWHESLPKFTTVAESPEMAEEMIRNQHTHYKTWSGWAVEFKIDGYEITVKNAEAQHREDKIDSIIENVKVVEEPMEINEFITISEIATKFNTTFAEIISGFMKLGIMVSINHKLDEDMINKISMKSHKI